MSSRGSSLPERYVNLLRVIFPLIAFAGVISCGGSPGSFRQRGGGGGGNGVPCALSATVTNSPLVSKGVGQTGAATFMDMHLGTTTFPWPTIPFGGLRLWDTSTGWAQINTADNVYNWQTLDDFASASEQHGVDLLYNLARTPTWASSNPSDSNCNYADQGGPGQCHPPNDLNADGSGSDAHWIKWVSAVATRYKGRIKYYEIWNEWNVPESWSAANDSQQPQLVRMEQDARCVIEGPPPGLSCNSASAFPSGTAIDSNARIVTPAPVSAHSFLDAVSGSLSNYFQTRVGGYTGGTFADIIGFHGYVGTTPSSGLCPNPEEVSTVIDDLSTTVSGFGQSAKPWFNTEAGWSKANEEGFNDPDRQAAFLARYVLLQRSLGVDRLYWYRWDAANTSGGSLWTPGSGITPAGTAYGEVYNWIVGATLSNACTPSGTIWSCGFTRSNGYKALTVWDASQDCTASSCPTKPFSIPAGTTYTEYRNLAGGVTSVSGSTVPVGAKPILLETAPLP